MLVVNPSTPNVIGMTRAWMLWLVMSGLSGCVLYFWPSWKLFFQKTHNQLRTIVSCGNAVVVYWSVVALVVPWSFSNIWVGGALAP